MTARHGAEKVKEDLVVLLFGFALVAGIAAFPVWQHGSRTHGGHAPAVALVIGAAVLFAASMIVLAMMEDRS